MKILMLLLFLLLIILGLHSINLLPPQIEYFFTIFDFSNYTEDANRNSLQERSILAYFAFETGLEYFCNGVGVGNYPLHNPYGALSHNSMLEMFAEYGLIGLIYFLFIFFLIPLLILKSIYLKNILIFEYIVYALLSYSIMSLTLVSYYSKFTFLTFIIMIVLYRILRYTEVRS